MNAKLACTLLLSFATAGCGGGNVAVGPHGLVVDASVSAVSLAYDCAAEKGVADCASFAPNCGFCQQSNVQIDVAAAAGSAAVDFRVLAVRIYRSGEDTMRSAVTARDPQRWQANGGYEAWDQVVSPGASMKVSYNLSAPDWGQLEEQGGTTRLSGPGPTYRVELDVSIDGVVRTISIDGVTREPEVVT